MIMYVYVYITYMSLGAALGAGFYVGWISGFLDFWISGFLDLWISGSLDF